MRVDPHARSSGGTAGTPAAADRLAASPRTAPPGPGAAGDATPCLRRRVEDKWTVAKLEHAVNRGRAARGAARGWLWRVRGLGTPRVESRRQSMKSSKASSAQCRSSRVSTSGRFGSASASTKRRHAANPPPSAGHSALTSSASIPPGRQVFHDACRRPLAPRSGRRSSDAALQSTGYCVSYSTNLRLRLHHLSLAPRMSFSSHREVSAELQPKHTCSTSGPLGEL